MYFVTVCQRMDLRKSLGFTPGPFYYAEIPVSQATYQIRLPFQLFLILKKTNMSNNMINTFRDQKMAEVQFNIFRQHLSSVLWKCSSSPALQFALQMTLHNLGSRTKIVDHKSCNRHVKPSLKVQVCKDMVT